MTEETQVAGRTSVAELMPLDVSERERKRELERIVDDHMVGFVAVGEALAEINTARLYRPHETFEEYVAKRFEMSRRRAYQLIAASAAAGNVNNCAQIEPANEAQARPLTLLPESDQPSIWRQVVESAPLGKVTARDVTRAVLAHLGKKAATRARQVKDGAAQDPELPEEFRSRFNDLVDTVLKVRERADRESLRRYIQGLLNLLED